MTKKWSDLLEKMRALWEKELTAEAEGENEATGFAKPSGPGAEEEEQEAPAGQAEDAARTAGEGQTDPPEGGADEAAGEIAAARLAAQASRTAPKEDPSVHEFRRSANELAYLEDVKNFN